MLMRHVELTEREATFYIAEMLLAVYSLHKIEFVHRDLKPENFLIDIKGQ